MQISARIANSKPLATTAIHGRVEALRNAGECVIDFSIAISHFEAPESVRKQVADTALNAHLPYTTVGGALPLRSLLAEKVRAENGINAQPMEVIVTNGAKQALYEALYVLTDPGDTVIVLQPYWPAYVTTAQLLKLQIVLVEMPRRIDRDFLSRLPAAKLIILNNPHNPTGKVFMPDELISLAVWMRRSGCGAIVDESYEKLLFEGNHRSLAAEPDWRELGVVTIYSASQSYAMMGWRSGFAVAPGPVVRAMETLQGPITAAASALTQVATGAAFASSEPDELVLDYRARRDLIVPLLNAPWWLKVAAPASGPYLWCDVRALQCDTVIFAERLLTERRVAIMPGDALGVPGFVRIGFIADDVPTLLRGLKEFLKFGDEIARGHVGAHAFP